jgi:hypothetical protein
VRYVGCKRGVCAAVTWLHAEQQLLLLPLLMLYSVHCRKHQATWGAAVWLQCMAAWVPLNTTPMRSVHI